MNKKKLIKALLLPIVCIIAGLVLGGFITSQYIEECNNAKLPSAEAVVVDMHSYDSTSRTKRTSRTVYVVTYRYEVDGKTFDGEYRSDYPNQIGNTIQIKYNPDDPLFSTAITKPDTKDFIIILIFSIVLVSFGVLFTIVMWKNRFVIADDIEDKPYYHGPKEKNNPKAYLNLLFPIGFLVVAMVLMYFQPFAPKSIEPSEFVQIMETDGYTAENSLSKLQTEFGMGSIIEQAYSVYTNDIRIDYCVLNTTNNAKLLYDSASLPIDNNLITDKYFVASQDDDFFYVKTFKNNTFVYGGCKIESKDELLRLLKDIGYYNN